MQSHFGLLSSLVFLLIAVVACASPAPTPVPTATSAPTPTLTPTPTVAPVPTPTPRLSAATTLTPTPTPGAAPALTPTPTLTAAPATTPPSATAPVELSAADAEALLHENAARVHDEIIRNLEHCRFTYAYAGFPPEHHVLQDEEGWVVEQEMVLRDGRLTYSGGSRQRIPPRDGDAARIPEGYDWGLEIFDVDHDPVEWFGAELRSLLDDVPLGTYAGRSTYLGQPALRYETSVEREGADMPASALIVTDYLVENPYLFMENEYSVNADGVRQL